MYVVQALFPVEKQISVHVVQALFSSLKTNINVCSSSFIVPAEKQISVHVVQALFSS
jgi:hypothetical protein